VDGSGSGSCSLVGFGNSCVEPSVSAIRRLVCLVTYLVIYTVSCLSCYLLSYVVSKRESLCSSG
jgi:hypothetical protein